MHSLLHEARAWSSRVGSARPTTTLRGRRYQQRLQEGAGGVEVACMTAPAKSRKVGAASAVMREDYDEQRVAQPASCRSELPPLGEHARAVFSATRDRRDELSEGSLHLAETGPAIGVSPVCECVLKALTNFGGQRAVRAAARSGKREAAFTPRREHGPDGGAVSGFAGAFGLGAATSTQCLRHRGARNRELVVHRGGPARKAHSLAWRPLHLVALAGKGASLRLPRGDEATGQAVAVKWPSTNQRSSPPTHRRAISSASSVCSRTRARCGPPDRSRLERDGAVVMRSSGSREPISPSARIIVRSMAQLARSSPGGRRPRCGSAARCACTAT